MASQNKLYILVNSPVHGVSAYGGWAQYYDLLEGDRTPFLSFYKSLLSDDVSSILELACGTGVVIEALAESTRSRPGRGGTGRFVGLDESEAMLEIARKRDDRIEWICGDMRHPPVTGQFDLVFCCFNTLQWCRTDADLLSVFQAVRALLKSDGKFAFDIYQPNVDYLSVPKRNRLVRTVIDTSGDKLEIREDADYDASSKIYAIRWRLERADAPANSPLARLDCPIRHFFPDEVGDILSRAGLKMESRFGDLDRSRFTADSKKQVLVCTIAD